MHYAVSIAIIKVWLHIYLLIRSHIKIVYSEIDCNLDYHSTTIPYEVQECHIYV